MTKNLLNGLQIGPQTGAWVKPVAFNKDAAARLRRWLNADQIERLRGVAETAASLIQDDRETPSIGEQRLVLQKASELAAALSKLLEQAPEIARGELSLVFHKHVGGLDQYGAMASKLQTLARGIDDRLAVMPAQGRHRSNVFFIAQIAEVLADAGIKTSVSETSRFYQICAEVMQAANQFQSPAAAIRAFLKSDGASG